MGNSSSAGLHTIVLLDIFIARKFYIGIKSTTNEDLFSKVKLSKNWKVVFPKKIL